MQNIIIKNIEGQVIDMETIKKEIKELRTSGKRKVEEKLLKDYIKNGIVQFKNENEEWEDLEGDKKEKINEVVEIFKNLEKTEEKPKKGKKAKKEADEVEEVKTEEVEKPKKGRKAKKEVEEVKAEEVKIEEIEDISNISTKLIEIFEIIKNSDEKKKREIMKIVNTWYLEKVQKEIHKKEFGEWEEIKREEAMIKEEKKNKVMLKGNDLITDDLYDELSEIECLDQIDEELSELESLMGELDE